MRYFGMYDDEAGVMPDVNGPYEYGSSTRVLLSSDGLNEMLDFKDIAEIMTSKRNVSDTVNALVDAALFRGGHDNVTCIVLDFTEGK